jgi:hypothetical protein
MTDDAVPLEIGGHRLTLRYPLGVLSGIQRRLGCRDLEDVLARVEALQPPMPADGQTLDARRWIMGVDLIDLQEIAWYGIGPGGGHAVFPTSDDLGLAIKGNMLAQVLVAIAHGVAVQFANPAAAPDNPDPPPVAGASPSA